MKSRMIQKPTTHGKKVIQPRKSRILNKSSRHTVHQTSSTDHAPQHHTHQKIQTQWQKIKQKCDHNMRDKKITRDGMQPKNFDGPETGAGTLKCGPVKDDRITMKHMATSTDKATFIEDGRPMYRSRNARSTKLGRNTENLKVEYATESRGITEKPAIFKQRLNEKSRSSITIKGTTLKYYEKEKQRHVRQDKIAKSLVRKGSKERTAKATDEGNKFGSCWLVMIHNSDCGKSKRQKEAQN